MIYRKIVSIMTKIRIKMLERVKFCSYPNKSKSLLHRKKHDLSSFSPVIFKCIESTRINFPNHRVSTSHIVERDTPIDAS